jgi:hypothetical protein
VKRQCELCEFFNDFAAPNKIVCDRTQKPTTADESCGSFEKSSNLDALWNKKETG